MEKYDQNNRWICSKKVHNSKVSALKYARAFYGKKKLRAYFCNECKGYHITTKTYKKGKRR